MAMTTGGGGPLRGTLAAAATPLRDGGERLDEDAFGPLVKFLVAGGLDGILALGTTGEGIMLEPEERHRAAELFLGASSGRLRVAVHAGAQTTSATCLLAARAAEAGADAVAVIGPPYYPFDADELFRHFSRAAEACAPLPFYVYEFAGRSGYAVPVEVLHRLRDHAPNFVGMKVSDAPFDRFEPYLLEGIDVLVGPEALILQGLERGAVGAVSGLATAFPELVAGVVSTGDEQAAQRAARVREAVQGFPVPGSLKAVLGMRGVPVGPDCRTPLRAITTAERDRLVEALDGLGVLGPAMTGSGDIPRKWNSSCRGVVRGAVRARGGRMRIAVIGTGRMGSGLASGLSAAGHEVVFGSRDPEGAADTVQRTGANGAATAAEAVRDADVIVLAIPWTAVEDTLPQLGDLTGRIVLDITNPYVGGRMQPPADSSTTELIQEWAPGARVVKGFNHVYAQNVTRPEAGGQAASVLLAGDDPEAKDAIAGLARDIGFDPVDVGPATTARALTNLLAVLGGLGLGPDRPLKVLSR